VSAAYLTLSDALTKHLFHSLIVVSCLRIPFMVDFNGSLNATGEMISRLTLIVLLSNTEDYRSRLARDHCLVEFGEWCGHPSGLSTSYPTTLTSCHDARQIHETILEALWQ
jgi:hypothetical protein